MKKTEINELKCGGCGGEIHKLFSINANEKIQTVCCKCGSKSYIELSKAPTMTISWGEDSDGILCGDWN